MQVYDNLYGKYESNHKQYRYTLTCTDAPNWKRAAWFSSHFCPQIVADTFKTAVYVYTRSECECMETDPPTLVVQNSLNLFCPFREIDLGIPLIIIYLCNLHYYVVKPP